MEWPVLLELPKPWQLPRQLPSWQLCLNKRLIPGRTGICRIEILAVTVMQVAMN